MDCKCIAGNNFINLVMAFAFATKVRISILEILKGYLALTSLRGEYQSW